MDSGIGHAILLGLLIFVARVVDVTLATMRIVFISRGRKILAPVLGFFEMLIWLFALRQVIFNVQNPVYYLLFAGGFASGTFVGLFVEEKLALGVRIIRIVTRSYGDELIRSLREAGHGATSIEAEGSEGPVHVIFSIVRRNDIADFIQLVHEHNPRAFYSIEDVDFVSAGVFAAQQKFLGRAARALWRAGAKSK